MKDKLKNIKNGQKYIHDIIKNYNDGDKVDNIEILELLRYHPTK